MTTYALYDRQLMIEEKYSKSNINRACMVELTNNVELHHKVDTASVAIHTWLNKPDHGYDSKNQRLAFYRDQLSLADLREIVWQILVVVSQQEELVQFTQVVGQLFNILPGDDKVVKLKTMSEMMAICGKDADLFNLWAPAASPLEVLSIEPCYTISDKTKQFIYETRYLPPMLCEPNTLHHNRSSGYLTLSESLILGAGNHHEEDICLDALNLFNQTPLRLCTEMLAQYSEEPGSVLDDDIERKQQFEKFARESVIVASNIVAAGNKCYLTHKPDKRGRVYCQGYHLSYQGNSFRKAIIELHHEEVVDGI